MHQLSVDDHDMLTESFSLSFSLLDKVTNENNQQRDWFSSLNIHGDKMFCKKKYARRQQKKQTHL